jgi:hypothetical protein
MPAVNDHQPESEEDGGMATGSREALLPDSTASPTDSPDTSGSIALPTLHLQHLKNILDNAYDYYAVAKVNDLPDLLGRAKTLERCSIVAALDLAGLYDVMPEGGSKSGGGQPGEAVVVWAGRSYKITQSQFPTYFEVKRYADDPSLQIGSAERASLLEKVEAQYSDSLGLLASQAK